MLLFTDQGDLVRARMNVEGYQELSRVALLEPTDPFSSRKVTWAAPSFANRHVFARNDKELVYTSLSLLD